MAKPTKLTLSTYTEEALKVLGMLIKTTRIERGMTTHELCERANISRGLLHRIERGEPTCSIGPAFEAMWILGLQLFEADQQELFHLKHDFKRQLTLLPKRVRPPVFDHDF